VSDRCGFCDVVITPEHNAVQDFDFAPGVYCSKKCHDQAVEQEADARAGRAAEWNYRRYLEHGGRPSSY